MIVVSVLGGFVAFSPIASAECSLNDEEFVARQSNGFTARFYNLKQNGTKLRGDAKSGDNRGEITSGLITKSGRLKLTVDWDGDSVGIYTAHVEPDGTVTDGRTYDKTHPESWATWETDQLSCDP